MVHLSMEKILQKFIDKFTNEESWFVLIDNLFEIFSILLLSLLMIKVGKLAIRKFFRFRPNAHLRFVSERREVTLIKLLENVLTYIVFFITSMSILSVLGINVEAMLAGAGIVGLAVGFGAQSLVKDVITGFFIIFEDQFSVGDFVRIGQFEGTVEEIGLRTTRIKSYTGEINILPNGSILEVTNYSLHNSLAVLDIGIAYENDINKTEKILEELLETLPGKYPEIIDTPQLLGVQQFSPSEMTLRIVAETKPMEHWYIARMMRKEIKLALEKHGIQAPFPRLVMYSRKGEEAMSKQSGS